MLEVMNYCSNIIIRLALVVVSYARTRVGGKWGQESFVRGGSGSEVRLKQTRKRSVRSSPLEEWNGFHARGRGRLMA